MRSECRIGSGCILPDDVAAREVSLRDMGVRVRCGKKTSTAKGYLAVLGQLERYCGCDKLVLGEVSAEFVAGFGRFLVEEGLSAATVVMYKRTLRALLKDAFGPDGAQILKTAFAGVGSANESDTRAITAVELRKVAYADLSAHPWLMRVRDVFMVGVYGCGLTFDGLKGVASLLEGGDSGLTGSDMEDSMPAWRWMRDAAEVFGRVHGTGIGRYIDRLSEESYSRGLAAIGGILRLRHPLTPKSAVDGWMATARALGVGAAVSAAAATGATAYKNIMGEECCGCAREEVVDAARRVAGSITDLRERWYAMRCFSLSPEEVADKLQCGVDATGRIETYVPTGGPQQANHAAAPGRLLGQMLFFRCKAQDAVSVKKHFGTGVYVFSFRDGDRTPAFIRTDEMMTFMFLADVAGDTIRYFFPDESEGLPKFDVSETVAVTNGALTGHVGVVGRVGKDRLRVLVRIDAMNGAIVTAEIPLKFLRPV